MAGIVRGDGHRLCLTGHACTGMGYRIMMHRRFDNHIAIIQHQGRGIQALHRIATLYNSADHETADTEVIGARCGSAKI